MREKSKDYCASTFIISKDRTKICLIYHKKFQNWIQPGGHLIEGETPQEGAVREAKEYYSNRSTGYRKDFFGP